MSRTLYLRNLVVFSIFVAIIFATPFLFAEVSSPQIRLNGVQIPFHSRYNLNSQQTLLGQNTVLQLPDVVTQHMIYRNGTLDLQATLAIWDDLADQGRTSGKRNGLYPVKVVSSPNGSVDISAKTAIGYIDMDSLIDSPGSFSLARTNLPDTVEVEPAVPVSEGVPSNDISGTYGEVYGSYTDIETPQEFLEEGLEVTVVDGGKLDNTPVDPGPQVAPTPRPQRPQSDPLQSRAAFRCQNPWRTKNYSTSNCLVETYGNNFKAQVKHILNDLETVNQGRAPRVPTDPRFSLCIAYHESHLAPNAKNSSGAWGMYQVRDSTGREGLAAYGSIVPGFTQYNSSGEYAAFKSKMLNSPLAQADLHHSILLKKAEYAGLLQKLGQGTMTNSDYRKLAVRYNGGSFKYTYNSVTKAYREHYADRIIDCFRSMQSPANEYGQIANGVTDSQLQKALNRSKFNR